MEGNLALKQEGPTREIKEVGGGAVFLYTAAPLSTQEKLGASYLGCDPLHRLTCPADKRRASSTPHSQCPGQEPRASWLQSTCKHGALSTMLVVLSVPCRPHILSIWQSC